jgi:hypothetical protein
MSLPVAGIPRAEITLPSGGKVSVRGFTFDEVKSFVGADANAIAIAAATGVSVDDAKAWIANPGVPAGDVRHLIDATFELSGLGEGAQKSE